MVYVRVCFSNKFDHYDTTTQAPDHIIDSCHTGMYWLHFPIMERTGEALSFCLFLQSMALLCENTWASKPFKPFFIYPAKCLL